MDRYQQVFENNKKWIIEKTAGNEEYFKNMERGQHPDFLFIGCSDSRVPANERCKIRGCSKSLLQRRIEGRVWMGL